MVSVRYIDNAGKEHNVDVQDGDSLMYGALHSSVAGIDAECGGSCVCGTCHVLIDDYWVNKIGAIDEVEKITLEEAGKYCQNSRLACQVIVTRELDGIVVRMPETQ